MTVRQLHGDFIPAETVRELIAAAGATTAVIGRMMDAGAIEPGHWIDLGIHAGALIRVTRAVAEMLPDPDPA